MQTGVRNRTARPGAVADIPPLVAVLVSVYRQDALPYVQAAMQSLWDQDYPSGRLRIYLGIDGPLDPEVEAWIGSCESAFHRIIRNPANRGLHNILNRLLDSLEDETLVARMDADDLSDPARIAAQVAFLQRYPDVDVVGCSIHEMDENEQILFTRSYPAGATDLRPYMCKTVPVGHATACMRRSIFEHIRYTGRFGRNEDVALWFDLLAAGFRLDNLPQALYRQRITPAALHRRRGSYAWDEWRAFTHGIRQCYGLSWRYVYPLARLLFRLAPPSAMRVVYQWGLGRRH